MREQAARIVDGKILDEVIPDNIVRVGSPAAGVNVNTYIQNTPASTWSINHSLNRYPIINIYVDDILVDADVTITLNNISISFPNPTIGKLTYI